MMHERICLKVRVQPRADSDGIVGFQSDETLKIRITSPPIDNQANEHLLKFLARKLKIPKGNIQLISGQRSRNKILEIQGISKNSLINLLKLNGGRND
ncbi:MAG: DUF167 domain-containing protein [Candidatus Edwardsbacteria bacterium]